MILGTFRACSEAINRNRGCSFPLGATVCPGGVNFSVFSKSTTAVDLLLFDRTGDPKPVRTIRFDPKVNKTYHYWHVFVPDVQAGQIFGYRIHGPFEPERGMRFDPQKVLLDPYGKAVVIPEAYNRLLASEPGDTAASSMKSVVADTSAYDWEGDVQLKRPFARAIIYEMHVRGFTIHPGSGVSPEKRGTYAGLIEKIPYLKDLGITTVELLPVYQYDEQDAPRGFKNYWGYAPVSFFAPHAAYSSQKDPIGILNEFRDMVKALHRAGIEVILDNRQVKNFHAVTLLAAGVPMLLMGDEVRGTQGGNNNAYCQDNETSWFNWDLVEKHAGLIRFVGRLIAGRLQRDVSLEDPGLTLNQLLQQAKISWHGVKLNQPDWGADSHAIALTIRSLRGRFMIHIMINAYWEQMDFEIPPVAEFNGHDWKRWIDTSRESPEDICTWDEAPVITDMSYRLQPRSIVSLIAVLPKT